MAKDLGDIVAFWLGLSLFILLPILLLINVTEEGPDRSSIGELAVGSFFVGALIIGGFVLWGLWNDMKSKHD